MTKQKPILPSFGVLMPQEEMLEVKKNFKALYIGIPKEIIKHETRVAITPDIVKKLSVNHKILIEKN